MMAIPFHLSDMPHPTRPHIMEIIELSEGQPAPAGAQWIGVGPVLGGSWMLDGNIPTPDGLMSRYGDYERPGVAIQEAIDFALGQQVPLLYVELDARRCD